MKFQSLLSRLLPGAYIYNWYLPAGRSALISPGINLGCQHDRNAACWPALPQVTDVTRSIFSLICRPHLQGQIFSKNKNFQNKIFRKKFSGHPKVSVTSKWHFLVKFTASNPWVSQMALRMALYGVRWQAYSANANLE